MAQVIHSGFTKMFLEVPQKEAKETTEAFLAAEFVAGYEGDYTITRRADSPNGEFVNLHLGTRKKLGRR